MKKGAILFVLLALFLLSLTVEVSAQQKSPSAISVKTSQLTNGVLIVDVVKTGKPYELRCNDGAADCTKLKTGKYQMVELPKNFGMYECNDVEVYPESVVTPESSKKVGEYCLIEK